MKHCLDPRAPCRMFCRVFALGGIGVLALVLTESARAGETARVSVSSQGEQGSGWSNGPKVSPNGRYVVFYSDAEDLVENDSNRLEDYFLHDRQTQTTELISVSSDGEQGNGNSRGSRHGITPDGRYVAFSTYAWNFDERDCERCGTGDVFVRDRTLGLTILVSVSSDGVKGNGQSLDPSISADGRSVVFHSRSNNLVEEDTNRRLDLFVHDRDADEDGVFDEEGGISTIRITVGHDGRQSNGSSQDARVTPDGRFIVFESDATNLVPQDTNGRGDVFVHDRDVDENGVFDEPGGVATERVSIGSGGQEGEERSGAASITPDGRYVVFESIANNLTCCDGDFTRDVFVHDRHTGITSLVSWRFDHGRSGNGSSGEPVISADGRVVAFTSGATNLVEADDDDGGAADVYVYNRDTREMIRVSVSTDGEQGNRDDQRPAITHDGCALVFQSQSDNLVDDDTNEARDIFFRDLGWCVPGDINGDGVADLADFAILEGCLQGPVVRASEACTRADLDLDLDVDLQDFTILQSHYTGS